LWAGEAAWARGLPPVPAHRDGGQTERAPRPRPATVSGRAGIDAASPHQANRP
jgi:hypothetical protein